MIFYLKLYALTVVVFFVIDIIWLGIIAKGFYRRYLGNILSPDVNWPAAVVFYLIYVAGIVFFAVRPAIAEHSVWEAVRLGALFGFFTGRPEFLDIGILYALLNIIGTLAVLKFFRHGDLSHPGGEEPEDLR